MTQIKYIGLLLLFILFTGNTYSQAGKYNLQGSISADFEGKDVMLFRFKNNKIQQVDTTQVHDSKFSFSGETDTIELNIVVSGNFPEKVLSTEFFLEEGTINIDLDSITTIGGTFMNDFFNDFLIRQQYTDYLIQRFNQGLAELSGDDNFHIRRLIERSKYNDKVEFVRSVLLSDYGVIYFKDNYKDLRVDDVFKLFELARDETKNDSEIAYYVEFHKELFAKVQRSYDELFRLKGQSAADIKLLDTKGKQLLLSELFSKADYTLVEFWATWCGPCKALIPDIKKLNDSSDQNKLNIVSISIDELKSEKLWKKIIQEKEMNWEQYISQDDSEQIMKAYDFVGIPHSALINREGKIVVSGNFERIVEHYLEITK